MVIAWGRRLLTALVGIPMALCLLISDLGMLLLATTLCCLSLIEFTYNICPPIVPPSKTVAKEHLHHLLVVASDGFGHAILLRYSSIKYGLGLQLLGLCCAWVCDSAALIAGFSMGSIKLAPVVSPGKTCVGTIVGIVSSITTVLGMFAFSDFMTALPAMREKWPHYLLPPPEVVPFAHQVVLGTVLGVLCIVGDLVESFVKRVAGVKDSGTFFPGHGGCLDRMDSFLFVAPCLYYYCQFALT
uniref:Phosphatidate cytidylyltransferase n=1 Tax=Hyaloperonospora arabidopsidis (strain Emoy2) TaxID=559515 RepID=M4BTH8_HYAAE